MSSHKIDRISSEIARAISEILAMEARDELFKDITITGCDVTKDLSFAKVYFTSLSIQSKEKLEYELNEAKGFIRTELSKIVNMRHTPELRFIYDNSIEYGENIENIIKKLDQGE